MINERYVNLYQKCKRQCDSIVRKYVVSVCGISMCLNIVFAMIYIYIFNAYYETNDDNGMECIVAGARDTYNSHIMFINILIGKVLKSLYILFPHIRWYVCCQWIIIFLAFYYLTKVLLNMLGKRLGLIFSCLYLTYFGYESYVAVQFTKTAGVACISGAILLFYAIDYLKREEKLKHIFVAYCLLAVGSMYRFDAFEMVIVSMVGLGVCKLIKIERKQWIKDSLRYVVPFIFIIFISFTLKYVDRYIYNTNDEWREYRQYNSLRASLLDYGFPEYEKNIDLYNELGISQTDLQYYQTWNIADPTIFNNDILEKLVFAKEKKRFDLGTLKAYFNDFPKDFFSISIFWIFLIVSVLYIVMVKNGMWDVFLQFVLAMVLYGYLFFQGRYLMNRVDVIFWYTQICILVYLLGQYGEKCIINRKYTVAFALTILVSNSRTYYLNMTSDELPEKRVAQELTHLMREDEKTLYMSTIGHAPSCIAWNVNEPVVYQGLDNMYMLGGWTAHSPITNKTLCDYNVTNPYQDIINNENIVLVTQADIVRFVNYIQENYDVGAYAALTKSIANYQYYKIQSGELLLNLRNVIDNEKEHIVDVVQTQELLEIRIEGNAYIQNCNSFAIDSYIQIEYEDGQSQYFYLVSEEDERYTDPYNGKYSKISGTAQVAFPELQYNVYLLSEINGIFYRTQL